jgi:hypothetical protein
MRHLVGDGFRNAGSAPRSIGFEALKYVPRSDRRTAGAGLSHCRVSAVLGGDRRYTSCLKRINMLGIESPDLLLEHLFDLSDLFFNFAGVFFGVAFGL